MTLGSIVVALLCLALLIGWHELGHFLAARACGIQVLRFSIGFGKPLFMCKDKQGTEYSIAMIPFGGYVRMLGEDALSEGGEALSEKAFSAKPVWQRLIVVLAGPIANLVLAVLLLTAVNLGGVTVVKPVVGIVDAGSPAQQAGMKPGELVTAIDRHQIADWSGVSLRLVRRIGDTGNIVISVLDADNRNKEYQIPVNQWLEDAIDPNPLGALGLNAFVPHVPAIIDQVHGDKPAWKAGLQPGDTVLQVDGEDIQDWQHLVNIIQRSAGVPLAVEVERNAALERFELIPEFRGEGEQITGFAGMSVQAISYPEDMLIHRDTNIVSAVGKAVEDSYQLVYLVIISLYKLVTGDIAVGNLSGPIGIIKIAGQSAASGLVSFLAFTAYLSVSLGVLNLLPIPVLDGGQALFLSIEGITRRRVPERLQEITMRAGIILLISIMLVATIYDILKL